MSRALAVILFALALAAPPAHGAASLQIGIGDDNVLVYHAAGARSIVAQWKALGVDVVRIHARWVVAAPGHDSRQAPKGFHPTDPDDPQYNWGLLDRAVRLVRDAGIEPILSVSGSGPLWTSRFPERGNPRQYPDPAKFADFATAVATRYRDDVGRYIVWNEPDQPGWLQPQFECRQRRCTPVAPHLYRELYRAADPAIRAADPGAQVLAGALAPRGSDPVRRNAPMRPLTFIRALGCVDDQYKRIRTGRCRGFKPLRTDGFSYHPHGVLRSPGEPNPQPDEAAIADLPRLEGVLDRVAAAGGLRCTCPGKLPLHLTEFGYQTSPPDPYNGVSPERQARWLQQAAYVAWHDPRVKTLIHYEWRDEPLADNGRGAKAYSGWQSGLLFSDSRPKPALYGFANPFWIDVRPGRKSMVWGQVRPGDAHSVRLQRRLPGEGWTSLGTIGTDVRGYFSRPIELPRAADFRFTYTVAVAGRAPARQLQSTPLSVTRDLGVLPVR